MKSNEYKRLVRVTLAPVKTAKAGIRSNLRKAAIVNIGHAISGVTSEISELMVELKPFLLGEQLTDAVRSAARPEFGDLLYYVAVGARDLKVKLPSSTKKVRDKSTITTQILALTDLQEKLLGLQKKQYYGQEFDLDAIKATWEQLVERVWSLSLTLFNEPPAEMMAENIVKLKTRYPDAQWDAAAVANKNHANEAAAVAASKSAPAQAAAQ